MCAEPQGGCGNIKFPNAAECASWHGCVWRASPLRKCVFDETCRTGKAQGTMTPSKSPVETCRWPSAGCSSISGGQECGGFNGCRIVEDKCVDGGCQPLRSPTRSPTMCIDVPLSGCSTMSSLMDCEQYTCCTWMDESGVCAFTPATQAPVPTPMPSARVCRGIPAARCRRTPGCLLRGNICGSAF
jgi:hypothetical protein